MGQGQQAACWKDRYVCAHCSDQRIQNNLRTAETIWVLISIILEQAALDCKTFATDELRGDAAGEHSLGPMTHEITVAGVAMAVLGEGEMIRHPVVEIEPAEPAVGELELNLVAQNRPGSDASKAASIEEASIRTMGRSGPWRHTS